MMADDTIRQEGAQEEMQESVDNSSGGVDTSAIVEQISSELEELEDEQIEWTEDMMPKFETPVMPGQGQASAEDAKEEDEEAETTPADSAVAKDQSTADVKTVRFAQFAPSPKGGALGNLDLLLDVKMPLAVELGRTRMLIRDILELGPGSVIELDKAAGEPVDLLVNGKLIARGEVVVIDESFGLRITEIAGSASEVAK